jgi:hypothetical protein
MTQYYITTVPSSGEEGVPPRLVFDALTELTPTFGQKLTSYAISDRSNISTNTKKVNTTISASGWISSCPVKEYENNLIRYDDIESRPLQAYELLRKWEDESVELTVSTEYEIFSPVIITKLVPVNTGSDALNVSLNFEVARRVSYKRVRLIQQAAPDKKTDGKNNTSGSSDKTKLDDTGSATLNLLKQFGDSTGLGDRGRDLGQALGG